MLSSSFANCGHKLVLGALFAISCMLQSPLALADSECGGNNSPPCPVAPVEINGPSGLMNVGYTLGTPGNGAITAPSETGTIGGVSIAQIMSTYKPPCAGPAGSPVPSDYFATVLANCTYYVGTYVPWYQPNTPYTSVGRQISAACGPEASRAYSDPPRLGSSRCQP